MLEAIISKLKQAIEEGDIGKALEMLKGVLSSDSSKQTLIILLNSRYHQFSQQRIKGILSYEEITLAENRISNDLTKLIKQLSDEDIGARVRLSHRLQGLILKNTIGDIQLVNCNRNKQDESFWKIFDARRGKYFQFYFINACNTQMPQSLARRFIYEVIEFELDNELSALSLPKTKQQEGAKTGEVRVDLNSPEPRINDIEVENLPIGPTLGHAQTKFKEYFCKRFSKEFNAANQLSFDDFINSGIPKLKERYVVTVFQVTTWKSFMPEYLRWIMDMFMTKHANTPTFLFFFPVIFRGYIGGLPVPDEHAASLAVIQSLINDFNHIATCIEPLPPVHSTDLDTWLLELGEENPGTREGVIEEFILSLDPELRQPIIDSGLIDMYIAETIQAKIYNTKVKNQTNWELEEM